MSKDPNSLPCFRAVSKTVGPSKIIKLSHSFINTIAERMSCVSSRGCCSTHYRYIDTSLLTTIKLTTPILMELHIFSSLSALVAPLSRCRPGLQPWAATQHSLNTVLLDMLFPRQIISLFLNPASFKFRRHGYNLSE